MKISVYCLLMTFSFVVAGCSNGQPSISDDAQEIIDEKDERIEELESELSTHEDENAQLKNKLDNISSSVSDAQDHLNSGDYVEVKNDLDDIETEAQYYDGALHLRYIT